MLPLVLLLAQACVGEINLQGDPDECVVMWHILKAKPAPLEYVIPKYISIYKIDSTRSRWIQNLNLKSQKPDGFPENAKWQGRNQKGWRRILTRAQKFVNDPGSHPCPMANQFGGPVDGVHADDFVPTCWKKVSCGEGFVQAYYHRPAGGCKVSASDVRKAFNRKR